MSPPCWACAAVTPTRAAPAAMAPHRNMSRRSNARSVAGWELCDMARLRLLQTDATAGAGVRFQRDSADDDLHAPVLRLAHTRAGLHQQVRFAEALDADRALRYTVTHEFACDCLGASHRQALIVRGST